MFAAAIALIIMTGQEVAARPALECAEHLTNARAHSACLRDLLDDAEANLNTAHQAAGEEARDVDMMSGGLFDAQARLDGAQSAWTAYRDAECARRSALMMVGDDAREDIAIDCRVSLTRARAQELREE